MKSLGSIITAGALALALGCSTQKAAVPEGTASKALPGTAADTNRTTFNPKTAAKLSASDMDFVNKAAQGGLAEVQLGKMVAKKAGDPDVMTFVQQTLPTLQQHLQLAESTDKEVNRGRVGR